MIPESNQAESSIGPRLAIIIPVFNECQTVAELLRRVRAIPIDKQIIVIDDGSTDGTANILAQETLEGDIELITHASNRGKGAAVQSGLARVRGQVVIIQDADLEYDPAEYPTLLAPIDKGVTKVVYGSRFLGAPHTAMYFWHSVGNKFLTLLANVLLNTTLTDLETCYKVFTADIARELQLKSDRWGFDPEITVKIVKLGHTIYEVPTPYAGRQYAHGKKITWKAGGSTIVALLRYRLFD